jgi:hypothetical protein
MTDDPEIPVHTSEKTDARDKPVFQWDRLLAATSPLITQPRELAEHVRNLDGPAFRTHISENRLLPPEDWDACWAVSVFFEHQCAVNEQDWPEVKLTMLHVADRIGGNRLNNVRRLGTLVQGIAAGGLRPESYAMVDDFVRYLLRYDEASAIMSEIELRQLPRSPWARLARWLAEKEQDLHVAAIGLPKPVRMQTMAQEFGPKE